MNSEGEVDLKDNGGVTVGAVTGVTAAVTTRATDGQASVICGDVHDHPH